MGKDVEYDLEALKNGLTKLDKNIELFEEEIRKLMDVKSDYRRMISVLEAKSDDKKG